MPIPLCQRKSRSLSGESGNVDHRDPEREIAHDEQRRDPVQGDRGSRVGGFRRAGRALAVRRQLRRVRRHVAAIIAHPLAMNMLFRRPVPPWRAIGAPLFLALLAFATVAIAQAPPATAPATRPKIGLVLSGGGARGLTHIGVLEVMEEMRIPVDYIAATSMGSIVGGLYSSGRTPADVHTIVTTLNWNTLFSDSPPRRELDFRDKQIDLRFPLPLEIGFRDGEVRGFQGALSGANLELFLHELTASADGIRDLDKLPIPFRAVATDMVAGKSRTSSPRVRCTRRCAPACRSRAFLAGRGRAAGSWATAASSTTCRSTSSAQMGADVVIAVNIGTPLAPREALSSIIGLTGQMINILTEQNVRIQLASLREGDVLISPNLGALTSSQFDKSREFIELGVAAAREAAPKLAAFSLSRKLCRVQGRAADGSSTRRRPGSSSSGSRAPATRTRRRSRLDLDVPIGEPLDAKALDDAISRLYGTSEYERIDYHVVEENGRTGLAINVREKPIGPNFIRFGLNYATDFQGESTFSLLAGLRRVWINSLGAQWTNELEVGRIARAATEFYQPLDLGDTVFVAGYASVQSVPRYIFDGSQRVAEYRVQANTAGFDVGVPFGNTGEIRVGPIVHVLQGQPDRRDSRISHGARDRRRIARARPLGQSRQFLLPAPRAARHA